MSEKGLRWAPTGVGPVGPQAGFGLRGIERFEGTRVYVLEGKKGEAGDPMRVCTYWFDETGMLVARYDPTGESDAASGVNDKP